ncbi:MAG: phospholipase A [Tepidisphaeraceae bacterium]|jgi:outer membrane phospholipase A
MSRTSIRRSAFFIAVFVTILAGSSKLWAQGIGEDSPTLFDKSVLPDANPLVTPIFADVATMPATNPDFGPASQPSTLPSTVNPAKEPETAAAFRGQFPEAGGTYGLSEFIQHFAPYEPMYFIGGGNIKYQFSLRYRFFDGPLAVEHPWVKGFNFGYTQLSIWDVVQRSPAFYDTNYMPELFYYLENVSHLPPGMQLGAQIGIGHESNGQGGSTERSLNIAFFRPIFTISSPSERYFISASPKMYVYISDLSDNPDIQRYRGNADIRIAFGERDGLQLATLGRIGSSFNRGSLQFDLTYPLTNLLHGAMDMALDAQYFTGYGETLLTYNRTSSGLRFGIALVR